MIYTGRLCKRQKSEKAYLVKIYFFIKFDERHAVYVIMGAMLPHTII